MTTRSEATQAARPLDRSVSTRCSECAHIGEHGWGLPHEEKRCGKIKERQADFDAMLTTRTVDPVDAFRFRPTDGVLPYQYVGKCRYFERANVEVERRAERTSDSNDELGCTRNSDGG